MKKKRGKLFVISGPSGAGKSTLINDLLKDMKGFVGSVSMTTRPKRKNEIEGTKYIFVSDSEFEDLVKNDELLEHAEYCGFKYGTSKDFVQKQLKEGKNVILEIEVKGAMQIKKCMPDSFMIFIVTPSKDILKERLNKRNTESKSEIEKRIEVAKDEMSYQKYYDCIIVNNDYNETLLNLKHILQKQKEC